MMETQLPDTVGVAPPRNSWPLPTRIVFRFTVIYFGFIIFPFPLETQLIPYGFSLFAWWQRLWTAAVQWVGLHILHIHDWMVTVSTGSGDKTFNWVQELCFLVLAIVATLGWSVFDRKRETYPAPHKWVRLWIRLYLASRMFGYGAAKAIPVQMPGVPLYRLLEPYGSFSPMGALWTFIGASKGYEITTGCIEILAGLLLIVPRTTLLGAMVSIVALTQVFLLNMFYDVPVKIFSFQLLLMGIFIIAPDALRLIKMLFLNRAVRPSAEWPLFRRTAPNRAALAVQILLGLLLLGSSLIAAHQSYDTRGPGAPMPPFYGIWSVKKFSVDGIVKPPLLTDKWRWRNVIFDRNPEQVSIESMDQKFQSFSSQLDLRTKSLVLEKSMRRMQTQESLQQKGQFSIQRPTAQTLILDGTYEGHQIHTDLERIDETKFLLNSRGFHWINELPFDK